MCRKTNHSIFHALRFMRILARVNLSPVMVVRASLLVPSLDPTMDRARELSCLPINSIREWKSPGVILRQNRTHRGSGFPATDSRWRTPNGLAIGDDLLTIERRNGRPFRLAGFSSEVGHGDLRNWEGGRLGNIPNCNIGITFQPRSSTEDGSLIRQVTSLSQVSSGHPAMQTINPKVVALWIRHPMPRTPANTADAILDVLVWGIHMPIDPALYSAELRAEVQQYLRRASLSAEESGAIFRRSERSCSRAILCHAAWALL